MHVTELSWIEPTTAMRCLADRPYLTFLDSAANDALLGRYSYLACDPFCTYVVTDGRASCDGETLDGDPWDALRALLSNYRQSHRRDLPPFQGGVAGFFSYDLNTTLERLPSPAVQGQGLTRRRRCNECQRTECGPGTCREADQLHKKDPNYDGRKNSRRIAAASMSGRLLIS
ncbi:hypothetical protein [Bradyrhizobium sp. CCBAU 11357]|uniref:hypothetical protein n=1 Tax=Bradyrhizobium sp. CCBAU 11357 TaxID=1630808 RepID=UPI002303D8FB|nr:hypothetical protein [Bradyrhizobium sp. CCBAU 11357]